MPVPKRAKWTGVVLIVIVGLLNFHPPHFLFESANYFGFAERILELGLLANLLGAIAAAIVIYQNQQWGWVLGVIITLISFVLYVAQQTVGLPGLPKAWLEPSRIVSVIVEVAYVVLALRQLA
jgi:hypothetical protein